MFEAGVRSGDTLCVINPSRTQDNAIGAKLSALKSLHAKGVTRVDMTSLLEGQKEKVNNLMARPKADSFEEL